MSDLSPFARRVAELIRARALRAIIAHDESLAKVMDKAAEGVRRDLRATGFTIAQVREVLEKNFADTFDERRRLMEDAILDAAREARVMPQETYDIIFGKGGAAEADVPFAQRSQQKRASLLRLVRESEDEPRSTD